MEETDVQTIIQRAREGFPGVTPRLITDNGPQFIARDFKEFIRLAGMTPGGHVTSITDPANG
jgi:transposase InsO family protein